MRRTSPDFLRTRSLNGFKQTLSGLSNGDHKTSVLNFTTGLSCFLVLGLTHLIKPTPSKHHQIEFKKEKKTRSRKNLDFITKIPFQLFNVVMQYLESKNNRNLIGVSRTFKEHIQKIEEENQVNFFVIDNILTEINQKSYEFEFEKVPKIILRADRLGAFYGWVSNNRNKLKDRVFDSIKLIKNSDKKKDFVFVSEIFSLYLWVSWRLIDLLDIKRRHTDFCNMMADFFSDLNKYVDLNKSMEIGDRQVLYLKIINTIFQSFYNFKFLFSCRRNLEDFLSIFIKFILERLINKQYILKPILPGNYNAGIIVQARELKKNIIELEQSFFNLFGLLPNDSIRTDFVINFLKNSQLDLKDFEYVSTKLLDLRVIKHTDMNKDGYTLLMLAVSQFSILMVRILTPFYRGKLEPALLEAQRCKDQDNKASLEIEKFLTDVATVDKEIADGLWYGLGPAP